MSSGQIRVAATYIRGGTSKGVFFNLAELPLAAQVPGSARDALLLRVIGSPDPYGKHTDGMGGATSSTSKTVIVSPSAQDGHDVDYLFGQVSIDQPFVDWSGNCGNLSAAVGPYAIAQGMLPADRFPQDGIAEVRIWQANIGVTFPGAEIAVDFLDPADSDGGAMFPTGNLVDDLEVPGVGTLKATLINAGIPTIFLNGSELGYTGCELQDDINGSAAALARFETIRAHGAIKMGLIDRVEEAQARQHTPKVAFVGPSATYQASSGKDVEASSIDLVVRALSMGKLHHAMMGTAAVAIGTAAAIPGTLVNLAAGGGQRNEVTFGHPSGTLKVGAEASLNNDEWRVTSASMSRSARILMEGWVRVPGDAF